MTFKINELIQATIQRREISPTSRIVYMYIAMHSKKGISDLKSSQIQFKLDLSRNTLNKSLRELIQGGVLYVHASPSQPNVYEIVGLS